MQTNPIKHQNMNLLNYCIHCSAVCYSKRICPSCEQTLTKSQSHALSINYLAIKPFIDEYMLTIKELTNEFIIIRGGEVEIFKRQVLTLDMWNFMVEHLISGYEGVGVILTDLFNKKEIFNKNILDSNKKLEDFILAVVREKFPEYQVTYSPDKDYVSVDEIRKYIWRKIFYKGIETQEELQIIEYPDKLEKWAVITDQEKVFNIIRIYTGRKIDRDEVLDVIELFKPIEKPKTKSEKLLNKIETEFWNFQIILTELLTKLKALMGEVYNQVMCAMAIEGECSICKNFPKESEEPKKTDK